MSLEAAIRTMITNGATVSLVPDARVTHGYRLQDSALPAITYEVGSVETISAGSSQTGRMKRADVTVNAIALEAVDALAIAAQVALACVPGTYSGVVFSAVIYGGHYAEAATAADGDEAEPAIAVSQMQIFYTE